MYSEFANIARPRGNPSIPRCAVLEVVFAEYYRWCLQARDQMRYYIHTSASNKKTSVPCSASSRNARFGYTRLQTYTPPKGTSECSKLNHTRFWPLKKIWPGACRRDYRIPSDIHRFWPVLTQFWPCKGFPSSRLR